jgi:multicomponent Na+:H+ antiporter subunit B
MIAVIDLALLALLAVTGIALLKLRNLFAVVILSGIYSLLSAGLFVTMDAPDVAFTESAVGVGVATVLMLGALALVGHEEAAPRRSRALPLAVVVVTGVILLYGLGDIPPFGEPDNPAQRHVVPRYLEQQPEEIDIPNAVSAVLASYRGYDTMGETAVIFTAGVGVLILLTGRRRRDESQEPTVDD